MRSRQPELAAVAHQRRLYIVPFCTCTQRFQRLTAAPLQLAEHHMLVLEAKGHCLNPRVLHVFLNLAAVRMWPLHSWLVCRWVGVFGLGYTFIISIAACRLQSCVQHACCVFVLSLLLFFGAL